MSPLDIIIAVPLFFFLFKGWKRGAVNEIFTLAGIIVGARLAARLATQAAEWLHVDGKGAVLAGFLVVFAAAVVGAYILGKAIEGFLKLVKADWLNHLLGALGGVACGLCILSVLLNFILFIDNEQHLITPEVQTQSVLYKPTYTLGNHLTAKVHEFLSTSKNVTSKNTKDAKGDN